MGFIKSLFNKGRPEKHPHVSAIIVSAGSGERMGDISKLSGGKTLLPLHGQPLIAYSMTAFQRADFIDEIVVVCRESDIVCVSDIAKGLELDKVCAIVKGGDVRQQSVENGIKAASKATKYIAVHDGARPLIEKNDIDNTVRQAIKLGAAAVGTYAVDTLKKVFDTGYIAETIDRKNAVHIQTPQVFEIVSYMAALGAANQSGQSYTDDCQLYESIGKQVKFVAGSRENIKITTEKDLVIAEALLERRFSI